MGVKPVEDPESPWAGKIPISPVMDTQIDRIVIKSILNPLRKQVLKDLDLKLTRCKREDWFEIFLVIFILLNNVEIATAHDHEFATFYGHVVRNYLPSKNRANK